jgi:hypothetical protein
MYDERSHNKENNAEDKGQESDGDELRK